MEIPIGTANWGVPQFSPDGLLLAVSRYEGGTGIFVVADGTLVRKLPGGSLRCAWNFDGSRLAVARSNWPDIELWDTRTWTMQKRLSLYDPKKGRPRSEQDYGLNCFSLCFDRWENLYVVEQSDYHAMSDYWLAQPANAFPYDFPGQAVFWRSDDTLSEIPPTSNSEYSHFLALASVDDATCLVCSGSYEVEIWSVQTPKTGPGAIRRKFPVPELAPENTSVSLTADGKYLAACTTGAFFLLKLFNDHVAMIDCQPLGWRHERFPMLSTTDVAANGSVAAFASKDWVTVVEIPSGRPVLEINARALIALSPNGRLLAAAGGHSVGIYRIPQ